MKWHNKAFALAPIALLGFLFRTEAIGIWRQMTEYDPFYAEESGRKFVVCFGGAGCYVTCQFSFVEDRATGCEGCPEQSAEIEKYVERFHESGLTWRRMVLKDKGNPCGPGQGDVEVGLSTEEISLICHDGRPAFLASTCPSDQRSEAGIHLPQRGNNTKD